VVVDHTNNTEKVLTKEYIMMSKLTLLALVLLSNSALAKKNLHSHEHGHVELSIAYEKNLAEIELETPADSFFGFEHAPKNDKEKAIIEKAKKTWENLLNEIIVFPKDLNCQASEIEFKHAVETKTAHDKHEKHESDHSEVEASAKITCAKDLAGTKVDVLFIGKFPKAKKLKLEIVGPKSQSLTLKKSKETITL